MSSELFKAYTQTFNHAVGNISSFKIRVLANGALVDTADIDNFTLVELGFDANGERICKQLSAVANKGYLIASVERMYVDGEPMTNFFNAVGERARIIYLDEGLRFETSAFSLNAGVSSVVNGLVAHFDPATKKFILSSAGAPHANYASAKDKFVVVNDETEVEYTIEGKEIVRLEVIK